MKQIKIENPTNREHTKVLMILRCFSLVPDDNTCFYVKRGVNNIKIQRQIGLKLDHLNRKWFTTINSANTVFRRVRGCRKQLQTPQWQIKVGNNAREGTKSSPELEKLEQSKTRAQQPPSTLKTLARTPFFFLVFCRTRAQRRIKTSL